MVRFATCRVTGIELSLDLPAQLSVAADGHCRSLRSLWRPQLNAGTQGGRDGYDLADLLHSCEGV